ISGSLPAGLVARQCRLNALPVRALQREGVTGERSPPRRRIDDTITMQCEAALLEHAAGRRIVDAAIAPDQSERAEHEYGVDHAGHGFSHEATAVEGRIQHEAEPQFRTAFGMETGNADQPRRLLLAGQ